MSIKGHQITELKTKEGVLTRGGSRIHKSKT